MIDFAAQVLYEISIDFSGVTSVMLEIIFEKIVLPKQPRGLLMGIFPTRTRKHEVKKEIGKKLTT